MNSRSPYSQYDESDRQTRKSPSSALESTSSKTDTKKKNKPSKMKGDQDMAREEWGTTRSTRDRSPGTDKNSDSYYSDEYENTTYGSEGSPTPSSISPRAKKADYKVRSIIPVQTRGIKRINSKFPSSKRGPRWGFRSQSLNKESSPKDIDMVTKRVLSARLLKINELRNEVVELQMKLEEYQKENKTLKTLHFRQEKALNKFEDTENEISQLLSRHNNEVRILRERLRKSQERERNIEKKLKETEDELYRTNVALKKLKQLSENRHLPERDELTRKVEMMESRLDERERRVKELEKNIELTQSSFQRQLLSEKKKAHDVQEENKLLQEELQRLIQKLKEKERELDVKNIYAYRFSKPSPKKETEITPRKKGTNHSINVSVQTAESLSSPDSTFPEPPPLIFMDETMENQQEVPEMEQDSLAKQIKEEAERLKKEKEKAERKRDLEEKLKRDKEQKILEDKARKLREEWEKEELERKRKEQDKLRNQEIINHPEEDRLRKELLLAKMFEIDREKQEPIYSDSNKYVPTAPLGDAAGKTDMTNTKQKTYKFSEPTEKLFNGLPVLGGQERSVPSRRSEISSDSTGDITFGNYTPSFGKGRSPGNSQKKNVYVEPLVSTTKLEIKKEKKSNLMEQLFGGSPTTVLPSVLKGNDQTVFTSSSNRVTDNDTSNTLPWEQNNKLKGKGDMAFPSDGKTASSSRHHTQHPTGRPIVKAIDSLEDEIEEVAL
ncbi:PREDICTED: lebercilin [Nanorana parkeri]|uniref:lebercilin n=1 Tax=Nanorana parkeri TaxID=125878 RepID=UPI000854E3EB|nr:PREDICTED: lebercilin [Nanorana parkeri]